MFKFVKGDTEIRTSLRSEQNQLRAQGFKRVNDAPIESALKGEWAAYAVEQLGREPEVVSGLLKAQLVEQFGPPSVDVEETPETATVDTDQGDKPSGDAGAGSDATAFDKGGELAPGTTKVKNTSGAGMPVTPAPSDPSAGGSTNS